jgi:stage IV sporulation protein FB
MSKLRVTPGFFLLAATAFYLDEGVGVLGWCVLSCVLHELGHYLVGRAFGGRLRWLELSAVGAELCLDYPRTLSYGREVAVALAGPAANLVTGWAAAQAGQYLLAGVSFGLGGFNLLPILPLDGGKALWCGLTCLFGAEWGERVLALIDGVLVGLLVGAGAVAAAHYANFTLLIAALWLLWMTLRGGQKKTRKNGLLFGKQCGNIFQSKKGGPLRK